MKQGMIQGWVRRLLMYHVSGFLRKNLDGAYVGGMEELLKHLGEGPLVLAANHVSRWDAMLLMALEECMGGRGWALMDAQNLARYPFFRSVGALPLHRDSPLRALRDLRFARSLLQGAGDHLWIFPQGRQRPQEIQPLGLAGGIRLLSGIPVVPVSFSYHFSESFAPVARIQVGKPLARWDLEALEASILKGLAKNLEDAEGGRREGRVLVPALRPSSEWGSVALSALWKAFGGGSDA